MRKVIIILTALAITGLAYWGYIRLSGSPTLDPPTTQHARELELPESTGDAQRIGQTTIHGVDSPYYITRDPVTRQVARVFGFSRLNNPGSHSTRWQVEKPYIIFYESSYQCRIDADNGLIQTERAGASISPKDGQLEGNVVIHIKPQPGSAMAETTLTLDDLLFSSERTEFSTDGPVRMTSTQAELSGRGLVLLINAVNGQIEYLHILELESLRLKDFVQTNQMQAARKPASPDTEQHQAAPETTVADRPDAPATDTEPQRAYQCIIENNVMIRYGDQLVVAGADQVNIQNILLARQDAPTSRAAAKPAQPAPHDDAVTPPAPVQTDPAGQKDSRDVIVTCDGGIIVKPMPTARTDAAALAIEMNGTPLRIEQIDPLAPDKMTPLAHCGLLTYDIDDEVLRLFSDAWKGDILLSSGPAGRIETQGPVVWDRKANHARIVGPGTVFWEGKDSDADAGQIAFAGQMELFFADAPTQQSALHLTAANLTGGMSANLRSNGILRTAAETAQLTFGPQNALTGARLEGAVKFESADDHTASSAASHTAVFHFDDNHQLARADLTGSVQLDSDTGRLHTEQASIAFALDETGTLQPSHFSTAVAAALETRDPAAKQPPARFEARNISYDLQTGSGRAAGPVRFVFYQPADPNRGLLTEFNPIEITADGDTEFIAGAGRKIEKVVFNRNVKGLQTLAYAAYTESHAFGADTMTLHIGRNTEGSEDIRKILLHNGDVYAESKRTHETLTLGHTRLTCREILYDRQTERLVATGPGQIEVDNSKAAPSAADGPDLSGPSFAKMEGFNRIEWSSADRRIIADGDADILKLYYYPLVDGVVSRQISAAAGRVEMNFTDDPDGRSRLAQLTAKERVFFQEKDKHILEGYALVYDAAGDGWMSITGTDDRNCFVDGAQVPYIHYNLNTGQLETRLSTIPGAISIPQ